MGSDRETCALCHREIEVSTDTPSSERPHRIEGAGQLCAECYDEVAKNKAWHDLA